ncbi:MAG: hypothetical protein SV186_00325 [Candidatus Nanohaloarchaea archaeon]|nr:hypothetical protein [Candidatus Nanohaloarchaea archaeon]
MQYIAKNVLGVFVVERDQVIDHEPFPDDPEAIADRIDGECREEQKLSDKHDVFEKRQHDAFDLGRQTDLIDDASELYQRQHDVTQEYTRDRIEASHNKDKILVQATRAINDLDEINNRLIERLRSWYELYFPEAEAQIDDHDEFARQVAKRFDRDSIDLGEDINSTGMEFGDRDREILQQYAERVMQNRRQRDEIETYVKNLAEKIAPNLAAVLGKLLAARMIALAGSLEDLAKMPSSTIQVLGAEKALFRHMRGEGSAPKHGILFMHTKVRGLPDNKRGTMSRFIANKASIAARLDHFDGDYKGDELKQEISERYQEVTDR